MEPSPQLSLALDKIFLGDCRDLLRSLPDECVDLVVSSPQLRYHIGRQASSRRGQYETKARRALQLHVDEQTPILKECCRILKKTGSLFWQVGVFSDNDIVLPLDILFFPLLESLGLIAQNRIILAKKHGADIKNRFSSRHATILWFTKSHDYIFNLDDVRIPPNCQSNMRDGQDHLTAEPSFHSEGNNPGDIWPFSSVTQEQAIHPAQFPEEPIARIVLRTTKEGCTVFDPYMGSGTVAVVARDLNRHFIGAEIDPKYHDLALKRLSKR
jgi:adenine-specific DNA-methyltransferase